MPSSLRCSKPECGEAAAARLTFDHAGATAWLDGIDEEGGWALCADHARRLRVPLGWTRVDRRRPPAPTIPLAS